MATLMILIVSVMALAISAVIADPPATPRPPYVNVNKFPNAPAQSGSVQSGAATILAIPLSVLASSDDHADDARSAVGVMKRVVEKVINVAKDVREKVADVVENVRDKVSDFVDDAKAGGSSHSYAGRVFRWKLNRNKKTKDDSDEKVTFDDNSEESNSTEKTSHYKDDSSKDNDKKIDYDDDDSRNDDSRNDDSKNDDSKNDLDKGRSSEKDKQKDDSKEKISGNDKVNGTDDDNSEEETSAEKTSQSKDDSSKDNDKKKDDDDSKNDLDKGKSSKQKDDSKDNISGKDKVNGTDDSGEVKKDDVDGDDKNDNQEDSREDDGRSVWSWLKDLTGDIEKESGDDDTKVRHYLTHISKFRSYLDAMDSNIAVAMARQSGTCPVYPIQVGNNRVTITTENGCKIIIKLKGLTVDKIEDGRGEKKQAHKRSVLVSYADN